LYQADVLGIEGERGYEEGDVGKEWVTEEEYKKIRHLKEIRYRVDLIEGFQKYPGGDV